MEPVTIRNSSDLRAEIFRLEGVSKLQGDALRVHISSPGAVLSALYSIFFKSSRTEDGKEGGIFNQDFLGLISRFILPVALNKTIFRNSNFLVKALVGLVSQKAANYITEDSVGNIWHKITSAFDEHSGGIIDKVTSLFEGKKSKKPAHVSLHRNKPKAD